MEKKRSPWRRVVRVWRAPEDKPNGEEKAKSMLEHFEYLDNMSGRDGGDDGK